MNARTSPLRKRAPADLRKDAGGFDLPIELGLLLGNGQITLDRPGNLAIVGELALTGDAESRVKLWDVATGRLIRTLQGRMGPHPAIKLVGSLAFSPDGRMIAAGCCRAGIRSQFRAN